MFSLPLHTPIAIYSYVLFSQSGPPVGPTSDGSPKMGTVLVKRGLRLFALLIVVQWAIACAVPLCFFRRVGELKDV